MLKSAKRIEKKEKEVPQLGLCTFPSLGSSCFILEFVFDFRKDNLAILVMRYLFPYQRPIFLDFWKDNLMILEIKFLLLSKTNSPWLRVDVFEAYRIRMQGDP